MHSEKSEKVHLQENWEKVAHVTFKSRPIVRAIYISLKTRDFIVVHLTIKLITDNFAIKFLKDCLNFEGPEAKWTATPMNNINCMLSN